MLPDLLKAFAVGFCVAVPAGPVLLFVLQKTLGHGRGAGLVCGLGSASVDTTLAALGLYALSLASAFISEHTDLISLVGGVLIMILGVMMSRRDVPRSERTLEEREGGNVGFAVQTAGLAASNPGAFAAMLAALTVTGLQAGSLSAPVWAVLLFIFCGEVSYWSALTFIVSRFISVSPRGLRKFSLVSGLVIAAVGLVFSVKGLIMIL